MISINWDASWSFVGLCDGYRRVIERITWLECLPSVSIWQALELQDLYRREVDLRGQLKAAR